MKSPFSLLTNLYLKEGSGILKPLPKYGFRLYFRLVLTYGMSFLWINMLTVLLMIPIVTAPAAICAMSRVLMKMTLDGVCLIKEEFWGEFKNALFRYLPFFSIGSALSVLTWLLIYTNMSELSLLGLGGYIIFGFGVFILLLIYLIFTYAIVLFVSVELPIGANIRNAVLLTFTQPKTDLLLIAFPLIFTTATVLFVPYTAPLFLFFIPVFTMLMSCVIIKPVLQKEILLLFEEQE